VGARGKPVPSLAVPGRPWPSLAVRGRPARGPAAVPDKRDPGKPGPPARAAGLAGSTAGPAGITTGHVPWQQTPDNNRAWL
jgi:hypothetical protein